MQTTNRITIFVLFLMTSLSIFAGNHDKIIGEWKIDIKKIIKETPRVHVDSKLKSIIKEFLPSVKYLIFKDRMIVETLVTGKYTLKYKIIESKGKNLKIEMSDELGQDKGIASFTILNDSSIKLSVKGDPQLFPYYLTKSIKKPVNKKPKLKNIKDKSKKLLGKWVFNVKSTKEYTGNLKTINLMSAKQLNNLIKKMTLIKFSVSKTKVKVNLPKGLIDFNEFTITYKIDSIKNNTLQIVDINSDDIFKIEFLSPEKINIQLSVDGAPVELKSLKLFFDKN